MTDDRVPPNAQATTAAPAVAALGDSWLLAPDPTQGEQLAAPGHPAAQ